MELLATNMNIANEFRYFRFFFGPVNNKWSHSKLPVQKTSTLELRFPSNISELYINSFKVVDSCWISSTEWPDPFRSFFVHGKKQESRKKSYIITVQKKNHLPEEV